VSPVRVVVAAMVSTMTSWLVSGLPPPVHRDRGEEAVLDLFHFEVPGWCRAGSGTP
jgi:hypothetical protein